MKAKVVFDNKIQHVLGELSFNKALNLFKVVTKNGNLYIPESSIDYVMEVKVPTKRRSTHRKK